MTLIFKGKTNDDRIWVKYLEFRLPNGEIVCIGRNVTEYVIDSGYFEMKWRGCYEAIGTQHNYRIPSTLVQNAELVSADLYDDAPDGYEILFDKIKADS